MFSCLLDIGIGHSPTLVNTFVRCTLKNMQDEHPKGWRVGDRLETQELQVHSRQCAACESWFTLDLHRPHANFCRSFTCKTRRQRARNKVRAAADAPQATIDPSPAPEPPLDALATMLAALRAAR